MKRAPRASRVDQPIPPAEPPTPSTETLADGRRVTLRPIRGDDVHRNAAFLGALSPPSKHFLFLGAISQFSDEQLRRLCDLDYAQDMAFVALADEGPMKSPRQVGVCRYAGADDAAHGAEISVAVADDWQHQGLGKLLLRRLIDYARTHGVQRLYSMDSIYNDRMRKLARELGFAEHADPQDPRQVIFSLMLR
jgi:RimJ/RimL family protein N-acetyltransferase